MVCVGLDPEAGEDRGIADEEAEQVMEHFGSVEPIETGTVEYLRLAFRGRANG